MKKRFQPKSLHIVCSFEEFVFLHKFIMGDFSFMSSTFVA